MSFVTRDGIIVYDRKDWDARPPRGPYGTLGVIMSAVVHHGGPVGAPRWTKAAAAATCRSWQNYHIDTHGWTDIGYHLLLDAWGRVYLGRPVTALGAHVLGQNSNRVGINLMQDGRQYGMTAGQKRTLRKLIDKPHNRLGLPALKTLITHPGDRYGVFGHKEVPGQSTECPGDLILNDLHKLIREAT